MTCLIVLWVTFKFALGFLTNHKADLAAECLGQSNDFSLMFLARTPINEAIQAHSKVIKATIDSPNFIGIVQLSATLCSSEVRNGISN